MPAGLIAARSVSATSSRSPDPTWMVVRVAGGHHSVHRARSPIPSTSPTGSPAETGANVASTRTEASQARMNCAEPLTRRTGLASLQAQARSRRTNTRSGPPGPAPRGVEDVSRHPTCRVARCTRRGPRPALRLWRQRRQEPRHAARRRRWQDRSGQHGVHRQAPDRQRSDRRLASGPLGRGRQRRALRRLPERHGRPG